MGGLNVAQAGINLWLFQQFIIKNFCLTLESNTLISYVDVYPLYAHAITFNANQLMSYQITFCLADTKKKIKIPILVYYIK